MALFEGLIGEVANKYGIGPQADSLVREVVNLITAGPGGLAGFLDKLKTSGLTSEVASWIGGSGEPQVLAPRVLESVLGLPVIQGIAGRVGLSADTASAALGYAIPRAVRLLTPGGAVPQRLPAEVQNFLRRPGLTADRASEQVAPERIAVIPDSGTHLFRWGVPLALLLGLAALFWWLVPVRVPAPALIPPAPVTSAAIQPRLWLSDDNGVASYSGLVRDETTRTLILDALSSVFGAGNIKGSIQIDPNVGPAAWLPNLRAALADLKGSSAQVLFNGNSVNVGGVASDSDRNQLISKLQAELGGGMTFGALADKVQDLVSGATREASDALAALKPGYSATDVVDALNLSIINFATGSAEIPADSDPLLQNAAAKIQQLPGGTVIEVAGYTDNVGDPQANIALSQRRADAVRNALIQAGVNPSLLVAKGYGAANPVSTNTTTEGRFRNRRIEYRVKNG
jgi:OOP family OmpA-OmpF porin